MRAAAPTLALLLGPVTVAAQDGDWEGPRQVRREADGLGVSLEPDGS